MATRRGTAVPLATRRTAGRAVRSAGRTARRARTVIARAGFPYRAPSVPAGVTVPPKPSKLGPDFETEWARRYPSRLARALIVEGPMRALVHALADPTVEGLDRLTDLTRPGGPAPAVIFTPNHHSHLDTPLSVTVIPEPWRHRLMVAGAADYFFTNRVTGTLAALTMNVLPIDRESTSRKSSDQLRGLILRGWSLVIYPEGGRSPDGWGQDFKAGAAYLSSRTGAPVVPMFIEGSGAIYGKGMKRPRPGRTRVIFGRPLWPVDGESTKRFGERIATAVRELGDESLSDWFSARRRAAAGATPSLTGPEHNGWRRAWALAEHRRRGMAGVRRRQKRRWPDLG